MKNQVTFVMKNLYCKWPQFGNVGSYKMFLEVFVWERSYLWLVMVQLTLVISTLLISNNRLSQSKNLVPA